MSDPHFIGILRLEPVPTDASGNTLVVASKSFAFFDSDGVEWVTTQGDVTDGASIPGWLKWIAGRSFETPYLPAAVLHDVYCKNKSRTWQATDRMFFQAMTTNGVNEIKAFLMWQAVRIGGPHW